MNRNQTSTPPLAAHTHAASAFRPEAAAGHAECTMGVIFLSIKSDLSKENLRVSLAVRHCVSLAALPPPPRNATGNRPPPLTASWVEQ